MFRKIRACFKLDGPSWLIKTILWILETVFGVASIITTIHFKLGNKAKSGAKDAGLLQFAYANCVVHWGVSSALDGLELFKKMGTEPIQYQYINQARDHFYGSNHLNAYILWVLMFVDSGVMNKEICGKETAGNCGDTVDPPNILQFLFFGYFMLNILVDFANLGAAFLPWFVCLMWGIFYVSEEGGLFAAGSGAIGAGLGGGMAFIHLFFACVDRRSSNLFYWKEGSLNVLTFKASNPITGFLVATVWPTVAGVLWLLDMLKTNNWRQSTDNICKLMAESCIGRREAQVENEGSHVWCSCAGTQERKVSAAELVVVQGQSN